MQMFHILKYSIILLLLYNILTVGILYFSNYKIKNIFWKFTPYEFNQLLYYPNHIKISNASNIIGKGRGIIAAILMRLGQSKGYMHPVGRQ